MINILKDLFKKKQAVPKKLIINRVLINKVKQGDMIKISYTFTRDLWPEGGWGMNQDSRYYCFEPQMKVVKKAQKYSSFYHKNSFILKVEDSKGTVFNLVAGQGKLLNTIS